MVDLLEYLRGDGRLYELVNNWGSAEVVQTQTEPKNVFYHVKNSQWEELWADDVFIYRGTDCSPGSGELYMLSENNHYGSAWVPRFFEVGQSFQRTATIIWRRKDNGATVPSKPTATAVTHIRLERIYSQLTFQSGIQLQNVAELHSYFDDGGKPQPNTWEKYFYAKGFGLVAFQDMFGTFSSWIAQKFTPDTMPQRVREPIPWLPPIQKRYYLPAPPAQSSAGQFIASKVPSTGVNMRSYPNVWGKDVGDLVKGDAVTLFTPEVDGWVRVQKNDGTSGWVSWQGGAVAFTPTTAQPLPNVKPVGKYVLTKLPSSWVNVRDYPNASGNDVGDLHKNDVVTMFAPEYQGWVYIEQGALKGWVSKQSGAVVFTPAADEPIPPDDQPPLPTLKPVGQYVLTKLPSSYVNVRAYPDAKGADVGDLHKGDVVTLYAPDVNGWVFAEMDGVRGWVSRQGNKVSFDAIATPPIPPGDLPPLPTIKPAGKYILSKLPSTYVNVRAYPDLKGADVGDLHKGDVVTLFTPDANGWVFIELGETRGWVSLQNGAVAFLPTPQAQTDVMIVEETDPYAIQLKMPQAQTVALPEMIGASIVPYDSETASANMPGTKADAIRMRDAFQHVEEGARRVRTELERLIGRMRD